jgi:hypothetical protein
MEREGGAVSALHTSLFSAFFVLHVKSRLSLAHGDCVGTTQRIDTRARDGVLFGTVKAFGSLTDTPTGLHTYRCCLSHSLSGALNEFEVSTRPAGKNSKLLKATGRCSGSALVASRPHAVERRASTRAAVRDH